MINIFIHIDKGILLDLQAIGRSLSTRFVTSRLTIPRRFQKQDERDMITFYALNVNICKLVP